MCLSHCIKLKKYIYKFPFFLLLFILKKHDTMLDIPRDTYAYISNARSIGTYIDRSLLCWCVSLFYFLFFLKFKLANSSRIVSEWIFWLRCSSFIDQMCKLMNLFFFCRCSPNREWRRFTRKHACCWANRAWLTASSSIWQYYPVSTSSFHLKFEVTKSVDSWSSQNHRSPS